MNIGFFGTAEDDDRNRTKLRKLQEMLGGHTLKLCLKPMEYFSAFAVLVKKFDLDAVIVTQEGMLKFLCETQADFRHPKHKNGKEKDLTLNDYHGSFIQIDAVKLGRDKPLDVLILNPLQHLLTVPAAPKIFKRHISKITNPEKWMVQPQFQFEVVTPENQQEIYERAATAKLMSVDIETPDVELCPERILDIFGFSILLEDGTVETYSMELKTFNDVLWIRSICDLNVDKITQGGTYDAIWLLRLNAPMRNWLFDTANLFHCWYSELPKRLDYITAFALRYVRFWKDDGKAGTRFDELLYNGKDCHNTLVAWLSLVDEAPEWAISNYLQEFKLNFPALTMELEGLAVNKEEYEKSKVAIEAKRDEALRKLQTWVHPNFNPGSSKQCTNLLLALGCARKIEDIESSGEKALIKYSDMHPLTELLCTEILEYRGYAKLLSTYFVDSKFFNWRLFYRTKADGTETGRLASSESSFWTGYQIQNVPRQDDPNEPGVKQYLEADPGWELGEADKAQSEARCVGYISGCQSLIDLVEGPHDYHSWNASAFFGVPYESVYNEAAKKTLNKQLRDLAKRTNHGANYNMGPFVMLETMGPKKVRQAKEVLRLPTKYSLMDVCAHLLNSYERTYPEVKIDFQKWILRTIPINRKLVSAFGWTRYCFDDPTKSKPALNSYIAHLPQNLSVAFVNRELYAIWRRQVYGDFHGRVRIKAQIHDSIFFQYKGGEATAIEVQGMMNTSKEVTDIKGVTRTLSIPTDLNCGKTRWALLK